MGQTFSTTVRKLKWVVVAGAIGYAGYMIVNPRSNDTNDIKFIVCSGESFHPYKKTIILIHGLASNASEDFPKIIEDAYLKKYGNDYNIIVVDWKELAGRNCLEYLSVQTRLSKVAKHISDNLIEMVLAREIELAKVHLIGYSIGAHICGMVGNNVHATLGTLVGRITGLDPAGFMYDRRKLQKTDAAFVDVVHTSKFLGTKETLGHLDVFVNGGSNQPICNGRDLLGMCSHMEGTRYFARTILDGGVHTYTSNGIRKSILLGANCTPETKGEITVDYRSVNKRRRDFADYGDEPVAKIGRLDSAAAKATIWKRESVQYEVCAGCRRSSPRRRQIRRKSGWNRPRYIRRQGRNEPSLACGTCQLITYN